MVILMVFAITRYKKVKIGFDNYFVVNGIPLSVWQKKLKIGGSNLTNLNFSNLGYQLKCIETLKHYQQSLAQPASTIKSEEK